MCANTQALLASALGLPGLVARLPGRESRGAGAQGDPLSALTPILPTGLASGREGAGILVLPSPSPGDCSIHSACVFLLRVSGLGPDLSLIHI